MHTTLSTTKTRTKCDLIERFNLILRVHTTLEKIREKKEIERREQKKKKRNKS